MENPSVVLYGVDDIRIENRPIPKLKPKDVLIEMACVGICGSDVHYWKKGRIANFIVKEPMVLGHEASGTIKEVGSDVNHLKPGDRVAIEPGVPCFTCWLCTRGKYNLCPDMKFCATPPIHGNLQKYYVHNADMCFKLPDHVSFESAALLEPLNCAVHVTRRAGIFVGANVLILGCGPIGLSCVIVAKYMGANKVIVADTLAERLKMAKEFGAYTMTVKPDMSTDKFISCIESCMDGRPDISIDAAGFEQTVKNAIQTTKSGGCAVIVGMGGSPMMNIPIQDALIREVDIRGVFRYANCYEDALSIASSRRVDLERLITHKFSLNESVKAFETVEKGEGIKVMIYCQK